VYDIRQFDSNRPIRSIRQVKSERRGFIRRRRILLVTLPLISFAVSVFAPREPNRADAAMAQKRNPTVIFALAGEPDEYHMDAVAIVDGKRLLPPFSDEQKDRQKKFAEKYFATGQTYRLMFGGGEAGSVMLKKWSEGCNTVHAEVTLSSSARLGGNVRALATNSDSIGKRSSARRAPTDAERSAVMTLVRNIYKQNRMPASLLQSIKVTNLAATDLDGDGKYEVVGSFTSAAKNKFERDLFLIAKPEGAGMRAEFVKFSGLPTAA
jgi:hypothetical protein